MQRERKLVFLVVLTSFMYGLSIFLNHGSFLLPFPLFDSVLIALSLVFFFWNIRDLITFRKWFFYLYFFFICLKFSTNSMLWSTFFDDLDYEKFQLSKWPDIIRGLQLVLFFPMIFSWMFVEKIARRFWISVVLTLVYWLGIFAPIYFFSFLAIPLVALVIYRYKPTNSLTYLLVLHAFFDLMSLSMLVLID